MRTLHGLDGLADAPHGGVLTIGNFDGLHRGHRQLLDICRQRKEQTPGASLIVVTFEPHPLTVLRPAAAVPRLSPAALKQELVRSAGADVYIELAPEPAVLNLSAEDFWAMLRDRVRPAFLVEGPDFTFGKARRGDVRKLTRWAETSNIKFELIEPMSVALLDLSLVPVSSSLIRWLLARGRVRDAAICLGRAYSLRGEVVKGLGRGRGLGYPTANLACGEQFVPCDGVYAGRCNIGGRIHAAAVSIGNMPTFGAGPRQIEAHVLDFDDDLYGQQMDLELVDWLRDQRTFGGERSLRAAIDQDIAQTRRRTALDPSLPIAQTAPAVGSGSGPAVAQAVADAR
jgi:riboflavin kinase/FMN adenylyltransferase